jgi:hypothetical protein
VKRNEIQKLMAQLVRFEIFAQNKEYNWLSATPKWPDLVRTEWREYDNEGAKIDLARIVLTSDDEQDAEIAIKLIKIAAADLERPILPVKIILTMINHPYECYDFANVSYKLRWDMHLNGYKPRLCELLYQNAIDAIERHYALA